ncbi:hypothetical protein GCM10022389_28290 [Flavobacterium cheonanense]|uniref:Polysaccharide (De)acetylase n=1 Tax=Flavobacterium cheonanense TaxID=706183 RepID=A0ABP7W3Y0_9FLAO
MNLRTLLAKNYINWRGWKTNRKIVVIESDDWGSIRTHSKEAYIEIKKQGINLHKSIFTKYDCLESITDLQLLFEVLNSVKDKYDNPAKITAVGVVANPDFNKIEKSDYKTYSYLNLKDSYAILGSGEDVLTYWLENGLKNKLLWPQFHGREHLNPTHWLAALNSDNKNELIAFENKSLLGLYKYSDRTKMYLSAFEYFNEKEKIEIEQVTKEGLKLFEETFGFKSKSFMASQSIRGEHLDKVLSENGVLYHQGGQQLIPTNNSLKIKNRYWGDTNSYNMMYWRRNCNFEPSKNQNNDSVSDTLKEIEIAFRWGKPAVISSHRVNFSGSIFPENREKSLAKLKILLTSILKKWPDVEFLTSDDLGDVMKFQK